MVSTELQHCAGMCHVMVCSIELEKNRKSTFTKHCRKGFGAVIATVCTVGEPLVHFGVCQ